MSLEDNYWWVNKKVKTFLQPIDSKFPKSIGMYIITDSHRSNTYAGSTKDLNARMYRHLLTLNKGIHDNKSLQKLFNSKNKELIVIFIIVDDREQAYDLEQLYLDEFYNSGLLCNIAKDARFSTKGYEYSDEFKQMMSKLHTGNTHAAGRVRSEEEKRQLTLRHTGNKYCLGRVLSEDTKKKISTKLLGKYFPSITHVSVMCRDYIKNDVNIYDTIAETARVTGVSKFKIGTTIRFEDLSLIAGYSFQKVNVNTIKPWLKYTYEEAIKSRIDYFNK